MPAHVINVILGLHIIPCPFKNAGKGIPDNGIADMSHVKWTVRVGRGVFQNNLATPGLGAVVRPLCPNGRHGAVQECGIGEEVKIRSGGLDPVDEPVFWQFDRASQHFCNVLWTFPAYRGQPERYR